MAVTATATQRVQQVSTVVSQAQRYSTAACKHLLSLLASLFTLLLWLALQDTLNQQACCCVVQTQLHAKCLLAACTICRLAHSAAVLEFLQDIINQLGMGKPGQPQLRQWVMPFQRTNLQLSVTLKNGTSAANNLAGLVADARAAEARGTRLEATLIYAQTTKEVDELAAYLQQQGVSAVK
jgi:hypothetical protein